MYLPLPIETAVSYGYWIVMRNAFINIGVAKSPLDAIQQYMAAEREILRETGIVYPGQDDDHSWLSASFHQQTISHPFFFKNGIEPNVALAKSNAILDEIRSTNGQHDVVLSSPYFAAFDDVELRMLRAFLEGCQFDPYVVCYLHGSVSPKFFEPGSGPPPVRVFGKDRIFFRHGLFKNAALIVSDFLGVIKSPSRSEEYHA